jgi:hypothetical protein
MVLHLGENRPKPLKGVMFAGENNGIGHGLARFDRRQRDNSIFAAGRTTN